MAFIKGIGVENYKLFKDRTDFEFAPITVLTGTNSSGKSSVINLLKIIQSKFFDVSAAIYSKDRSWSYLVDTITSPLTVDHIAERIGGFTNLVSKYGESEEISIVIPTVMRIDTADYELIISYKIDPSGKTKNGIFNRLAIQSKSTGLEIFIMEPGVFNRGHIYAKINYSYFYDLYLSARKELSTMDEKDKKEDIGILWWSESSPNTEKNDWNYRKFESGLNSFVLKTENLNGKECLLFDLGCLEPDLFQKVSELLDIQHLDEFSSSDVVSWNKAILYSLSNTWQTNVADRDEALALEMGRAWGDIFTPLTDPLNYSFQKLLGLFEDMYCEPPEIQTRCIIDFPVFNEILQELDGQIESLKKIYDQRTYVTEFGEKFFKEYVLNNVKQCFLNLIYINGKSLGSQRSQLSTRLQNIGNGSTLETELKKLSETTLYDNLEKFLQKTLLEFNIADALHLENVEDTNYIKIWIKKGDKKFLLADEGNGVGQVLPILLAIVTHAINNIEFGAYSPIVLYVEEPEANLHPALQSKLADMFYEAYQKFNIQFIIETHSEYLVRKMQYLTAKGEMKTQDSQIYYFHHPKDVPPGQDQVKKINILEDGSLTDDFGVGFFDEADRIAISLYNLTKSRHN